MLYCTPPPVVITIGGIIGEKWRHFQGYRRVDEMLCCSTVYCHVKLELRLPVHWKAVPLVSSCVAGVHELMTEVCVSNCFSRRHDRVIRRSSQRRCCRGLDCSLDSGLSLDSSWRQGVDTWLGRMPLVLQHLDYFCLLLAYLLQVSVRPMLPILLIVIVSCRWCCRAGFPASRVPRPCLAFSILVIMHFLAQSLSFPQVMHFPFPAAVAAIADARLVPP